MKTMKAIMAAALSFLLLPGANAQTGITTRQETHKTVVKTQPVMPVNKVNVVVHKHYYGGYRRTTPAVNVNKKQVTRTQTSTTEVR